MFATIVLLEIVAGDESQHMPPPLEYATFPVIVLFEIVGEDRWQYIPPP